jgi:hypothetical protein
LTVTAVPTNRIPSTRGFISHVMALNLSIESEIAHVTEAYRSSAQNPSMVASEGRSKVSIIMIVLKCEETLRLSVHSIWLFAVFVLVFRQPLRARETLHQRLLHRRLRQGAGLAAASGMSRI